jgi:prepilin-type N-terminal cleavage/methylation domain-containing protein
MTDPLRIEARRLGHARDGGFTLIESLTAATILLVIAVAIITTVIATGGWYANARMRTEATAVANEIMAVILSRNYGDIKFTETNENWPTGIHRTMTKETAYGVFTVETSLTPTVDPATGIDMTQVIVTAYPQGKPFEPEVSVIRFASGWQQQSAAVMEFLVPVKVELRGAPTTDGGNLEGVRVQLLNVNDLSETYYAVTHLVGGTSVADFGMVKEGQYFLTSDPRFGTDIRPKYFPRRVFPTHGGTANNPIVAVVTYTLEVVRSTVPAVLRVGVYQTKGFTNPQPVSGGWGWEGPDTPYKPVYGLRVYATPSLNATGSGTGTFGYGTTYPDTAILPNAGVYSGVVNAYGIAVIEIPWTLEGGVGQPEYSDTQYWTVWCTTKDSGGRIVTSKTVQPIIDRWTGTWSTNITAPNGTEQSYGDYLRVPQWQHLGTVTPVNSP